jgi:tetratricopeptide (TPR) repeat protein
LALTSKRTCISQRQKSRWDHLSRCSLLVVFFLSVRVLAAQEGNTQISEIIHQLRSGNNEQALTLIDAQIKSHPQDCRVSSLQGVALAGLSRQDEALSAFDRALVKCPDYLAALEGAGQIRYARKDKAAIPILEHIVSLQPTNLPAQAMLASALRNSGDCKAALPHFEASRSAFATRTEWMEGHAACLATTGDYTAALAQYRELQAAQPSDVYLYDIAFIEWRTGDSRQALATLEPLLASGGYEPALSLGSHLAEKLGDTPRAVDLLRKAILLAPDDVQNYLDFASIAFAHQSFQVGIAMVDAGLKRMPQSAPLYLARGVLKVQLSDQTQAAIADFEKAHSLDPKLSLSLDAIGIVKTQQHDNTASQNLFEEQAKRNPNDPVLHYLLAEQLSQSEAANGETLHRAIEAAKRATILDPHYLPAHDLLARLYLRAGEPRLAIEQAQIALADDPNDQEALYQELMATRSIGDSEAVRELSQKFATLRKANAERQQAIDRFRLEEVKQQP